MPYDDAFYASVNAAGAASAAAVLPIVTGLIHPRSAVDVGCGTGIWVMTLRDLGVVDVLGVDGEHVPKGARNLPEHAFVSRNLARPFRLNRVFDLVICVEVAEHLRPERATGFVSDLVSLAPAILFSAAAPGQGGTHHVNEQWPDYWLRLFTAHGYTAWDCIRPQLRYESSVAWIYRQNCLVLLAAGHPAIETLRGRWEQLLLPDPTDVTFEYVARYLLEREEAAKVAVRRAVGRRLRALRQ